MTRMLLRRSIELIPVLIGLTLVCFALIHLVPGNPAALLLGNRATPERVAQLDHQLGLDRPLVAQYASFLKGTLTLSWGDSISYHASVVDVIAPRILPSLFLVCYAMLVAIVISVPLALASARWQDGPVDHFVRLVTTTTFTMPPFWLGLLLVLLFSVRLGWFPSSGYGDSPIEHLEGLTLPALTIGLSISAPLLRTLRANLLEGLNAEYAEAALARGLSDRRVLLKHVFRNSMISTLTLMGVVFSALVGATAVVENVFAIPGLGSLMVTSVSVRDFPVVQSLTLIFGLIVLVVSLLTDVLYAAIDPRVRR